MIVRPSGRACLDKAGTIIVDDPAHSGDTTGMLRTYQVEYVQAGYT